MVGRGELWLIHFANQQGKLVKERPRKIDESISEWDNGTGDCVDENGIHFEKNGFNMKVLA